MGKKILILILLGFTALYSQTVNMDSLLIRLKLVDDTEKAEIYNQLSIDLQLTDPQNSLYYAKKALELVEENTREQINAIVNTGIAYEYLGDFKLAKSKYLKAQYIAQEYEFREELGRIFLNIGYLYDTLAEYDKSINYLKKAISIYKKKNDSVKVFQCRSKLSKVYIHNNQPQEALNIYLNSLREYKKEKDYENVFSTLMGIVGIYSNFSIHDKELEYNFDLLEIAQKLGALEKVQAYNSIANTYSDIGLQEEALSYYYKALELAQKTNSSSYVADITNNLGNIYSNNGDVEKALKSYREAVALFKGINDPQGTIIPMYNIASIQMEKGNYKEAKKLFEESLRLAIKYKDEDYQRISYFGLGNIYFSQEEYNTAQGYFKKSLEIAQKNKDFIDIISAMEKLALISTYQENYKRAARLYKEILEKEREIFNIEKNRSIAETNVKYGLLKKEKEIETLRNEKKLEQEKNEKNVIFQRLLLIIISISIVMIIVAVGFILKILKLNTQIKAAKDKAEKSLKELNEANENIIELERKNIVLAMGITANHEIRQPMMILTGNLEILLSKIDKDKLKEVEKYSKNIHDAKDRINEILNKYKDAEDISVKLYAADENMVHFDD